MGLYVMMQTTTKPPMKKTLSLKSILGPVILAWALSGSQPVQNANAQTTQTAPPPGTDLITSASPNDATTGSALPPDVDPNSPLAQVIRLVQAGVEQSVVLTYISNSTSPVQPQFGRNHLPERPGCSAGDRQRHDAA